MIKIPDLVTTIENSESVTLEARGGDIWASDKLPQARKEQLRARKPEILQFLRLRQYDRLTAQARSLATWLDDSDIDLDTRRERLPEYERLLAQISELQMYVDQQNAAPAGQAAPGATESGDLS